MFFIIFLVFNSKKEVTTMDYNENEYVEANEQFSNLKMDK